VWRDREAGRAALVSVETARHRSSRILPRPSTTPSRFIPTTITPRAFHESRQKVFADAPFWALARGCGDIGRNTTSEYLTRDVGLLVGGSGASTAACRSTPPSPQAIPAR
jgi:hypothetical protein